MRKLQFGNAYDQAPLGVCGLQAELEGRHSQARAWERDILSQSLPLTTSYGPKRIGTPGQNADYTYYGRG